MIEYKSMALDCLVSNLGKQVCNFEQSLATLVSSFVIIALSVFRLSLLISLSVISCLCYFSLQDYLNSFYDSTRHGYSIMALSAIEPGCGQEMICHFVITVRCQVSSALPFSLPSFPTLITLFHKLSDFFRSTPRAALSNMAATSCVATEHVKCS